MPSYAWYIFLVSPFQIYLGFYNYEASLYQFINFALLVCFLCNHCFHILYYTTPV